MGEYFTNNQSGDSIMGQRLGIGDRFPAVTVSLVDGGSVELPDGMDGAYHVILFYRGHW
jgi:peroxiredoxin